MQHIQENKIRKQQELAGVNIVDTCNNNNLPKILSKQNADLEKRGKNMLKKLIYIFHFHRMLTEQSEESNRGDIGGLLLGMLEQYKKYYNDFFKIANSQKNEIKRHLKILGERITIYHDSMKSIIQYVPQLAYLRKTKARGYTALRARENNTSKPLRKAGPDRTEAISKMLSKYKDKSTHRGDVGEIDKLLNQLDIKSINKYESLSDNNKKRVSNAYYTLRNIESKIRQKTRLRSLISKMYKNHNNIAFYKENGVLKLRNKFDNNITKDEYARYLGFPVAGLRPINIIKKRVDLGKMIAKGKGDGELQRKRGRPSILKSQSVTNKVKSFRAGYEWAMKSVNLKNFTSNTKRFLERLSISNNKLMIDKNNVLENKLENQNEGKQLIKKLASVGKEIAEHMLNNLFLETENLKKGIRLNELYGGKPGGKHTNKMKNYPESFTAELLRAGQNSGKIRKPIYASNRYIPTRLSLRNNSIILEDVINDVKKYMNGLLIRDISKNSSNQSPILHNAFKKKLKEHLKIKGYNNDLLRIYFNTNKLDNIISDTLKKAMNNISFKNISRANINKVVTEKLTQIGFDSNSIQKFMKSDKYKRIIQKKINK